MEKILTVKARLQRTLADDCILGPSRSLHGTQQGIESKRYSGHDTEMSLP